jgi:ABC-type glycerol-3-phosphate transport system substrate-binding protein
MNLDEEMKLWDERANDEFGKVLKKIKKATKDYLYSWEEMGIEYNILSEYITGYALDGNRKFAAKHIYNILENYDILGNHRNVKKLVNKMMDLANYIK